MEHPYYTRPIYARARTNEDPRHPHTPKIVYDGRTRRLSYGEPDRYSLPEAQLIAALGQDLGAEDESRS